jgi:Zn-dependent metalloprotease
METLPSNMFDSPETKDPMATFIQKDNEFQDLVKAEYCHYESRYFSALDAFLQAVGSSSLGNESQSNVQSRLTTTKELNKKLTLLIQIVNGTSIYKYTVAQRYQQGINSVNENLRENEKKLIRQREILEKENTALDMSRRMVEYTTEKNRANNNLLAIYGVLNIVALAMVFYVART